MIDFGCSATKVYSMEMITWLETGRLYDPILLVDNCVYPEPNYLLKYIVNHPPIDEAQEG
jgi:hypothetical protein